MDIAILGDGYTSSQMAKYKNDVQAAMTQLFNIEPFHEYRNFFNVHRIDVVSSQSGADHPERAVFVNTALDATYNCTGIQRLICVNNGKVFTVLGNSVSPSQPSSSYFMSLVTASVCLLTSMEVRRRQPATTRSSLLLLMQRRPPTGPSSNGISGSMQARRYQPYRHYKECRVV